MLLVFHVNLCNVTLTLALTRGKMADVAHECQKVPVTNSFNLFLFQKKLIQNSSKVVRFVNRLLLLLWIHRISMQGQKSATFPRVRSFCRNFVLHSRNAPNFILA